jgi:ubiquinone/menaquinone biosynthesis C-methylase UbiE
MSADDHPDIEYDQAKAEEYDRKDHIEIFSQAVMDVLKTWEWLTTPATAVETDRQKELEILDFGCGTGTKAIALARIGHNQITAVDVSPNMLEQFRNKLAPGSDDCDVQDRIQIIQAQPDGSFDSTTMFDAIFIFFVLHHIPVEKRTLVLSKLVQSLKPGGRFVVTEIDDTERVREVFAKFRGKKHESGGGHNHNHEHHHHDPPPPKHEEQGHDDEDKHDHHNEHHDETESESMQSKGKGENHDPPVNDSVPPPESIRNHHDDKEHHHLHLHDYDDRDHPTQQSKAEQQQEEQHDHNHDHHGKYHWLQRDQVAEMMKNAGIQSTTTQDLVIQHTEWTMDCYWVVGTK